jgi:hypothetical protein
LAKARKFASASLKALKLHVREFQERLRQKNLHLTSNFERMFRRSWRGAKHKKMCRYGCQWISICVKNHFYTSTCYPIFPLKTYLHLIPLLFILVNCFQFNFIPSWPYLLRRLAWQMSRSQIPRKPTWGSKYVAMRKELELGARSRLPALEGVRGAC